MIKKRKLGFGRRARGRLQATPPAPSLNFKPFATPLPLLEFLHSLPGHLRLLLPHPPSWALPSLPHPLYPSGTNARPHKWGRRILCLQMPAPSDLDSRSSAGKRLDVSAFYISFAATSAEPHFWRRCFHWSLLALCMGCLLRCWRL